MTDREQDAASAPGETTPMNDATLDQVPVTPVSPEDPTLDLGEVLDGADAVVDAGDLEPTSPPLIGEDGRVRLSFSRIDLYRTCPLRFRYTYIDKLPTKPATYLSFGTSIHSALEAYHDRTLFGQPSEDDLLQFLYDTWDSSGYAEVPRDKQLQDYHRARDVLSRYHRRVGDDYRPAADTEKWFELPVGDSVLVVGSIDRVDVDDDGEYHIVDYKTGKLRDLDSVRHSLQLALYALACKHLYGKLPATVSLDFVVPGTEVRVHVDELDLAAAERAAIETAEAVLEQRYDPNPTRLCDWCDHRAVCPAWEGPTPEAYGPTAVRVEQLRRKVRRELSELRALEDALRDGRDRLAAKGFDPIAPHPDDQPASDPDTRG